MDVNTIYAGTGAVSSHDGLGVGLGVLKSTDGGNHWTQFGADTFRGLRIRSIVPTTHVDPVFGTQNVLAGANGTAPHADSRELIFDSAGRIREADDGGLYRLDNPNTPASAETCGRILVPDAGEPAGVDYDAAKVMLANPATPGTALSGLDPTDAGFSGFDRIPYVLNAIDPTRMLIGRNSFYEAASRGDLIQNTFSPVAGDSFVSALFLNAKQLRTIELVKSGGVNVILVGGQGGIYRASDPQALSTWTKFGANMPNTIVSEVQCPFRQPQVGHWRGTGGGF